MVNRIKSGTDSKIVSGNFQQTTTHPNSLVFSEFGKTINYTVPKLALSKSIIEEMCGRCRQACSDKERLFNITGATGKGSIR